MLFTASGVERGLLCPASCALPAAETPDNEDSERGSALHSAVDAPEQIDQLPERFREEARDLAENIRELLPENVQTEVAVALDIVTGGARLLEVEGRNYNPRPTEVPGRCDLWAPGFVGDTKSGWRSVTQATRNPQLLLYAACNAVIYNVDVVRIVVIDARDPSAPRIASEGEVDIFDLDAYRRRLLELQPVVARLRQRYEAGDLGLADVTPGEHCRYCPSLQSCPSSLQLVRRIESGDVAVAWAPTLTPETAPEAYRQLKQVEIVYKRMSSVIHAYAAKTPIPLGDGRAFGRHVKPGNERLDGATVWDVVRELHGPKVAEKAVDFAATKAGIENALRPIAKPGKRAGMMREVLDEVRKRGGASRPDTESIGEYELTEAPRPPETPVTPDFDDPTCTDCGCPIEAGDKCDACGG